MARILITGTNGQVGFELTRSLATFDEIIPITRKQLDLKNKQAIIDMLDALKPDIIINPAAYTAVDKAETDEATAIAINAYAPLVLAEWVEKNKALLIHYSTDYVFDGKKEGVYLEEDSTNPQSVYGSSKRQGEIFIAQHTQRYVILRTSWVFGSYGNNFLKTILRIANERDTLNIINDQTGSPTSAALIADVTAHITREYLRLGEQFIDKCCGIFHLTSAGETTWHAYAKHILDLASSAGMTLKTKTENVQGIPSSAYPTPAKRPTNSRLNTSKLQTVFNIKLPDWKDGVNYAFAIIENNKK